MEATASGGAVALLTEQQQHSGIGNIMGNMDESVGVLRSRVDGLTANALCAAVVFSQHNC